MVNDFNSEQVNSEGRGSFERVLDKGGPNRAFTVFSKATRLFCMIEGLHNVIGGITCCKFEVISF